MEESGKALSRVFFKRLKDIEGLPEYSQVLSLLDSGYYALRQIDVDPAHLSDALHALNRAALAKPPRLCLRPLEVWVEHQLRLRQKKQDKRPAKNLRDLISRQKKPKPVPQYDTVVVICEKYQNFTPFAAPFQFQPRECLTLLIRSLSSISQLQKVVSFMPLCSQKTMFLHSTGNTEQCCFLQLHPQPNPLRSLIFILISSLRLSLGYDSKPQQVLSEIGRKIDPKIQKSCGLILEGKWQQGLQGLLESVRFQWQGDVKFEDQAQTQRCRLSFDGQKLRVKSQQSRFQCEYSRIDGDEVGVRLGRMQVCGRWCRDLSTVLEEGEQLIIKQLL